MRLTEVSLMIVFCFGYCNTEQNGNLCVRLSARAFDAFTAAFSNKNESFKQYFGSTKIEGRIGEISSLLYPDTDTAELSYHLFMVTTYDTQLHVIEGLKFEIGIQIQKNLGRDNLRFILSKCNFTTTPMTNSLETSYLTGTLQNQVCGVLQSQLELYQTKMFGYISDTLECDLIEPSGVFWDRVELAFSCNDTVENSATPVETDRHLPPMPEFQADQATFEIQSSYSLREFPFLAFQLDRFRFQKVTRQSTSPIFAQIVTILCQIANATGEDPILKLIGRWSDCAINSTHVKMNFAIAEQMLTEEYGDHLILHCGVDWKLIIQLSDGQQRWLSASDMVNANVSFEDIQVSVWRTTLVNNSGLTEQICNQLHMAFNRNQISSEINAHPLLGYYQIFLQDTAMVLKFDLRKLVQSANTG